METKEEFSNVFKKIQKIAKVTANKFLNNSDEANDVASEVIKHFYEKCLNDKNEFVGYNYKGRLLSEQDLANFVYLIAYRKCINIKKRNNRMCYISENDEQYIDINIKDLSQLNELIDTFFKNKKEIEKDIFKDIYIYGYQYKDISEKYNVLNNSTLRIQYSKLKKEFCDFILKYGIKYDEI